MNSYLTIILNVVEGSEKVLTFCIIAILSETVRTEWLRTDVFIFILTWVYIYICTMENVILYVILSCIFCCSILYIALCRLL